jgi:hypothetical protein
VPVPFRLRRVLARDLGTLDRLEIHATLKPASKLGEQAVKALTVTLTALVLTTGTAVAMCPGKMAEPRADGPQTTAETPVDLPGKVGS